MKQEKIYIVSQKNLLFESFPVDEYHPPQMHFVCHRWINLSSTDDFQTGFIGRAFEKVKSEQKIVKISLKNCQKLRGLVVHLNVKILHIQILKIVKFT
jgi:hypothetical protein